MKFESLFHYVTPIAVFFAALFMPGDKLAFLDHFTPAEHHSKGSEHSAVHYFPKQKGMTWVGKGKISNEHLDPLINVNADWVMLIPFSYQQGHNSNEIHMANDNSYYWGESDEGIIGTAKLAKQRGLKTLLKPHVWLIDMSDGYWRGKIQMDSEKDWEKWFASYEQFILYYAEMAEQHRFDAFCVGTELHQTARLQTERWRKVIRKVRAVYSGQLVYAANWMDEFEDVQFWDELDYIGIQAYFPLTDQENPSVSELKKGWQPHIQKISKVQKKYGKPVLFTEIGYKSTSDGAITPWEWPTFQSNLTREVSLQTQVNGYEAFFQVFWHEPWFAGAYFWDWYPEHSNAGGAYHKGFTPQNKPAESTIRSWYGKN